jgi:hypothetical protein
MIQDSILVCSPDLRIPHTAMPGRLELASKMSDEELWLRNILGKDKKTE